MVNGICDNCTTWRLQAGETWGTEYQRNSSESVTELIDVGTWRPSDGPALEDQLFPHVAHGFRKKVLPMISFHVSNFSKFFCLLLRVVKRLFFVALFSLTMYPLFVLSSFL